MYTLVVHNAVVNNGTSVSVDVVTDRVGNRVWVPLLVLAGALVAATVLFHVGKLGMYFAMQRGNEGDNDLHEDRDFIVNGKVRAVPCVPDVGGKTGRHD